MESIDRNDPQRTSSDRSVVADLSAEEKQLFEHIAHDSARRETTLDLKDLVRCLPFIW